MSGTMVWIDPYMFNGPCDFRKIIMRPLEIGRTIFHTRFILFLM